jgi:hypothetical protein
MQESIIGTHDISSVTYYEFQEVSFYQALWNLYKEKFIYCTLKHNLSRR